MSESKDHIDELLDEIECVDDFSGIHEQHVEPNGDSEEVLLLKQQVQEWTNKYVRQAADFDNYRKRLIKEADDIKKYANQSLMSNFLQVLDNFDLALKYVDDISIQALLEGIELNKKIMVDAMSKAGIERIGVESGDMQDPAIHEAIGLASDPELENNTVAAVIQEGYKIGDRVLRPARVLINKK